MRSKQVSSLLVYSVGGAADAGRLLDAGLSLGGAIGFSKSLSSNSNSLSLGGVLPPPETKFKLM